MPTPTPPSADQSTFVCDNHPDRPAAHTTAATLHRAISLCADCLRRVGEHIRSR